MFAREAIVDRAAGQARVPFVGMELEMLYD
jgi:hypothetical protein